MKNTEKNLGGGVSDNLEHNYRAIKITFPRAAGFGVMKADAYGHGAVPLSHALPRAGRGVSGGFNPRGGHSASARRRPRADAHSRLHSRDPERASEAGHGHDAHRLFSAYDHEKNASWSCWRSAGCRICMCGGRVHAFCVADSKAPEDEVYKNAVRALHGDAGCAAAHGIRPSCGTAQARRDDPVPELALDTAARNRDLRPCKSEDAEAFWICGR